MLDPKDDPFSVVALDVEDMSHRPRVLAHVEGLMWIAVDEESTAEDRMHDRRAQDASGREHTRELGDGLIEILDVHEHHEAHDEIGGARRDRQLRRVSEADGYRRSRSPGRPRERRGAVDTDDAMSERCQLTRQTAL